MGLGRRNLRNLGNMESYEFDLVFIGSGPAGQRAAIQAAKLGKRVAVVEKQTCIGGVCIETGTHPFQNISRGCAASLFPGKLRAVGGYSTPSAAHDGAVAGAGGSCHPTRVGSCAGRSFPQRRSGPPRAGKVRRRPYPPCRWNCQPSPDYSRQSADRSGNASHGSAWHQSGWSCCHHVGHASSTREVAAQGSCCGRRCHWLG